MRAYARDTFGDGGLERYSLTEYAKPCFHCRYVRATWDSSGYLGMGPAAYSRRDHALWENDVVHLRYQQKLDESTRPAGKAIRMSNRDCLARDIAMGLCLLEVDAAALEARAGATLDDEFPEEMAYLAKQQLIERDDRFVRLTEKGIRHATHVMKTFTT